jgi:hypothetical protein
LKTYLLETKKDMFAEKKKETNKKYTIVEFINILSDKKYLDKFSNIEDIKKDLELKNKLFYQKIEYFEYYCDKLLCKFYKDEEINIENQIIYPLKNNNFIDFLLDDKIIPDHKFKTIKTKIIPKLRMLVWHRAFGQEETGICPKCNIAIKVGKNGFHCGHIISEFNGGETVIDNLRPICEKCNKVMGKNNWIN